MTKKKSSLKVTADLSDLFTTTNNRKRNVIKENPSTNTPYLLTIENALNVVIRQMRAVGLRERTINDYEYYVNNFMLNIGVSYVEEISVDHIYEWLSSMDVSNQTKLTRLKCLKAFLSRCFDNGWIESKFWTQIRIKVDSPVKEGAVERDIMLLISLLDLSNFVHLRDASAVMLMFQTGVRLSTLSNLETKHINLESQTLAIDGDLLKNHEQILLPFDDILMKLLDALIKQNLLIRRENKVKNDYVFITQNGQKITTSQSHNNIQKRLSKYAKEFGIKNINPHAIRRGFAKRLLDRDANIALISKALGHSDLNVTSRYLHLDKEEVLKNLRDYL